MNKLVEECFTLFTFKGEGCMKILFIYYVPSGGVETLARQRSLALQRKGVIFEFLYYQKGSGLQNIKEKTYITDKDHVIQSIVEREKYNAIIVNTDNVIIEKLRKMGYKGKIIYEIQGLGSFEQAERFLEFVQPKIERHIDAILYPQTPHLKKYIEKYFTNTKKYCFHNCIDTELFSYVEGLPTENNSIIGWVGRIEENKNWQLFLKICARLLEWNKDLKVWMFGDDTLSFLTDEQKRKFENQVAELGLENVIERFSNVPYDQMPIYYSRIGNSGGFLCSTSKVEGFGYAIVEAMSCMCPVITTDSDGVKSFVFHNETGKIFPQDDVDAGVKEAKDLFNHPVLKQKIRTNARDYIQHHFSPEIYAQHMMNMFKELKI